MTADIGIIIVFGIVMVLFITEILPIAVTAMGSCAVIALLGITSPSVAWSGLSNETVLIVAGMMVVGTSLLETGVAQSMGEKIIHFTKGNSLYSAFAVIFVAMLLSSFMNNSTATATMIPVLAGIIVASKYTLHEKEWMLPLAVATNTGGLLTLLGSTPQLVIHSAMLEQNITPFGFFEYGYIGLPVCILFIVYTFTLGRKISRKFLEQRPEHSQYIIEFIAQNKIDTEAVIVYDRGKQITVTCILIISVVLMATTKTLSLGSIAMLAAALCIATKCIALTTLYKKFDWTTVIVLACTIGFANGLDKSGGGKLIADFVMNLAGTNLSDKGIFALICILGAVLTQFMSNTAICAMLVPIGLSIAASKNMNPHPILMGICMSTSCSFSTPVSTPAMTLVLSPGGYKFTDYMKWSGLLNVLAVILVILLTPVIWPF